jgi:hypothetical protein
MPWKIRSRLAAYKESPTSCPECGGDPPDEGGGVGECSTCGAILLAPDPEPGGFVTTTLVPVDRESLRPLPRRVRRTIRIQDGWRRQADGSFAKVYRLIDKANDHYVETVKLDGRVIHHVDEPLSQHRGHGAARRR